MVIFDEFIHGPGVFRRQGFYLQVPDDLFLFPMVRPICVGPDEVEKRFDMHGIGLPALPDGSGFGAEQTDGPLDQPVLLHQGTYRFHGTASQFPEGQIHNWTRGQ